MSLKRKSYSVLSEDKILISEATFNDEFKIIHSIDYRENPKTEEFFTYDEQGRLIDHREIQNNIENSREEFIYDEAGEIIEERLSIGGELFELRKLIKLSDGFEEITIQDGIEVIKIKRNVENNNWTELHYFDGELCQKHFYTFNKAQNSGELRILSIPDNTQFLIQEKYDRDGNIILSEQFNEKNSLLYSIESEFQKGLLIKETILDYGYIEYFYIKTYEYDRQNNLINFEWRTNTGSLISFSKYSFDRKNRIIEEIEFQNGSFDGYSGTGENINQHHFIHEYSEI